MPMLKVIIDFDGTLTAEETQVQLLAEKSLDTLASEIIGAPRRQLAADYGATRARLLAAPERYWWEVNGLVASYCDEGAFILRRSETDYTLKAHTTVEEFNEYFGSELDDEAFDTVGGLVIGALGHLPKRGESVQIAHFRFEVVRADSRRIRLLSVKVLPATTEEPVA